MGCDFSSSVKQDFTNRVSSIESLESKINTRHLRMTESFSELNHIESLSFDITSLREKLANSAERLEILIQEIEKLKQCKTNDTLKPGKSISKAEDISANFEEHSPCLSPMKKEEDSIVRQKAQKLTEKVIRNDSILHDPEILAMINKNRNLLLRKLTT
jgi:predicted RNase H-like nuclease (RuvC/YqgF family)